MSRFGNYEYCQSFLKLPIEEQRVEMQDLTVEDFITLLEFAVQSESAWHKGTPQKLAPAWVRNFTI